MDADFVNRTRELGALDEFARAGGLLVLFGRRRVGKTRLLTHWLSGRHGLYSQAIEATPGQQLEQLSADFRGRLSTSIVPRSWSDFFQLLDAEKKAPLVCLDEFPYLAASDPSLPSVMQRWLDHRKSKGAALILSGSSTRMMNDLFLNRAAPLFGRARTLLKLEPMGFRAFCSARGLNPGQPENFVRFSLVGGVPRYWELVEKKQSLVELAEALFFGSSPFLEYEPARLLRDEGVTGATPIAVLEAIGRGAEKPSEIAARLQTPQANLSRLFQLLLDSSIIERSLPWGESVRSTRRTLYRLGDPTLRFWFRVYSPHRTRWRSYPRDEKEALLWNHASTVFEDCVRARAPDAGRWWDSSTEFDYVREAADGVLEVKELKWTSLSKAERTARTVQLETRFRKSTLGAAHPRARFEVLDSSALRTFD